MRKIKPIVLQDPRDVENRLRKLSTKWIELLGEREKKMEGGHPVERIKEGAEGEIGPQLSAFRELFASLAYADRSNYKESRLGLFMGYLHFLEPHINAIKMKAEKEFYKFKEDAAKKGLFGRFEAWLYMNLMMRPGTPGWWKRIVDLAGRTIEEIEEAKEIIKEKFGVEL